MAGTLLFALLGALLGVVLPANRAAAVFTPLHFVTLTPAVSTLPEGDSGVSTVPVTVTLSDVPTVSTAVGLFTIGDSASAGDYDFVAVSETLTFAPGETSKVIAISITGDDKYEQTERFFVAAAWLRGAVVDRTSALITITNDDDVPVISIADASCAESGPIEFLVSLSNPSEETVTADVNPESVTADLFEDFTAATLRHVVIPPGETSTTVTVTAIADVMDEDDETFEVSLSDVRNATLGDRTAIGTITDQDDPPVISVSDMTNVEDYEFEFVVSLSHPSEQTITVSATTVDGTATVADGDYDALAATTITFLPGEVSKRQAVIELDNSPSVAEAAGETFFLRLSSPVNATLEGGGSQLDGTGTILDDDDFSPAVTFPVPGQAEIGPLAEGSGYGVTLYAVNLTLTASSNRTVLVDVSTVDGSATEGYDYLPVQRTVVFDPGDVREPFFLPVVGDDVDEEDTETMNFTLTNLLNASCASVCSSGYLEIADDDATPEMSVSRFFSHEETSEEGSHVATLYATLDHPYYDDACFDLDVVDFGATLFSDYRGRFIPLGPSTTVPTSFCFYGGEASLKLEFLVYEDSESEDTETFRVVFSNLSNLSLNISAGDGEVIILDDDPEPVVNVRSVSRVEGTGTAPTAFSFNVTLSEASDSTVYVPWLTLDGTATAPADYLSPTLPSSGTPVITFAPGDTSEPITVSVVADSVLEDDENFLVRLLTPDGAVLPPLFTGGTIGSISAGPSRGARLVTAVGAIRDDERVELAVKVVASPVDEGGPGQLPVMSFAVTVSPPPIYPVTVRYATGDGTARAADSDYTPLSGTLTFTPGGPPSQTLSVLIIGDAKVEADETFSMNLTTPTGASIPAGQETASGTIRNDDFPQLRILSRSFSEGAAGSVGVDLDVVMNSTSPLPVTFRYQTSDGTATVADGDYEAATGLLTIAPGALISRVRVTVNGDTRPEPDETVLLTLSSPTNATFAPGGDQATLTISNDDLTSIRVSDVIVPEGDGGTTDAVFAITVTPPLSVPLSVAYTTADGTATEPEDYTRTAGTALIAANAPGVTIRVPVLGENLSEPDETFELRITLPAGG